MIGESDSHRARKAGQKGSSIERRTWTVALSLNFAELWTRPATKVVVGFGMAALIIIIALATGYAPDVWNNHGLGRGWECTDFGKGAYSCAKDVPPRIAKA